MPKAEWLLSDRGYGAATGEHEADDLALILGLGVVQRPALDAYLAATTPPPPGPPPPPAVAASPTERFVAPGIERDLARREARPAERAAYDLKVIATARTFCGQLDVRQRRILNAVTWLRGGPGGPSLGGPGGFDRDRMPGG